MAVRAKFYVQELKQTQPYGGGKPHEVVVLNAVSDEQNKTWSTWTPFGRIEIQINNPSALEQFKVGDSFYVDFTPAPVSDKA